MLPCIVILFPPMCHPMIKHFSYSVLKLQNYLQGVKKVPDPKQNYIGLMTEG